VALTGLPVFMVLLLAVFQCAGGLEETTAHVPQLNRGLVGRAAALGGLGGCCFSPSIRRVVALLLGGYLAYRIGGRARGRSPRHFCRDDATSDRALSWCAHSGGGPPACWRGRTSR